MRFSAIILLCLPFTGQGTRLQLGHPLKASADLLFVPPASGPVLPGQPGRALVNKPHGVKARGPRRPIAPRMVVPPGFSADDYGAFQSYGTAATAPAFAPLHGFQDSNNHFPTEPPTELASTAFDMAFETLGDGVGSLTRSGVLTEASTGIRVRRNMLSSTDRDFTIADSTGRALYGTAGKVWTVNSRTHFYDAIDGRRIAMITRKLFSARWVYEIYSYSPAYPGQPPAGKRDEGDVLLYPFARFTRTTSIYSVQKLATLEKYEPDGLTIHWTIAERSESAALTGYDVYEPGVALPIGTIDQSRYFKTWSAEVRLVISELLPVPLLQYDGWITEGADLTLFSLLVTLIEINQVEEAPSRVRAQIGFGAVFNNNGGRGGQ